MGHGLTLPRLLLFSFALSTPAAAAASPGDSATGPAPHSPAAASFPTLEISASEPIDLLYLEPASFYDIYLAAGKALGINVLFEPRFRDLEAAFQLRQVAPERVLETLNAIGGHFYKVLDERTILLAQDTPQNRRTYEDQLVQTFYLEHADIRDVMTIVRSMIGAKHVAANEELNALVIRDTAAKVRIAEEIVRGHDKPQGVVAVAVELLEIDGGRLGVLTGGGESGEDDPGALPLRLDAEGLRRIRGAAGVRSVTRANLSTRSGREAELSVSHRLPPAGKESAPAAECGGRNQEFGLELRLEPEIHQTSGEISLRIRLGLSYVDDLAGSGEAPQPVPTSRELTSEVRLGEGETVFLSGLWSVDGCLSATSDRTLALLVPRACDPADTVPRHLLIALTPRISQRAGITDRDRLPLGIGTESRISDPRPIQASMGGDGSR